MNGPHPHRHLTRWQRFIWAERGKRDGGQGNCHRGQRGKEGALQTWKGCGWAQAVSQPRARVRRICRHQGTRWQPGCIYPTHREHPPPTLGLYQLSFPQASKLRARLFFLGTQLCSISQPPLQKDEVISWSREFWPMVCGKKWYTPFPILSINTSNAIPMLPLSCSARYKWQVTRP